MEKIKEAYCSKEVCELLKEKGFDIEIPTYIDKYGHIGYGSYWNWNQSSHTYSCPTHQMACALIRSKGYNIEIQATASGFIWSISKLNGTDVSWSNYTGPNDGGAWDDYDECTDAALNYLLKVLSK